MATKGKKRHSRPEAAQAAEPEAPADSVGPRSRWIWLACLVIVAAGVAAYSNSFHGDFVLDDQAAIAENPNLRQLWPPWAAAKSPGATTLSARPVLAVSLAVSRRVTLLGDWDDPVFARTWGHHAVNLLIHVLAALTLFGIARRTLMSERLRDRFGRHAVWLALAIALLWVVHPLHTNAVTYIVQRAESLVGMLYLLTLYLSIRAFGSARPKWWQIGALVVCAAGMATKEVMVTAPLMVLVYDRLFVSSGWRDALKKHRRSYIDLAATWFVLGYLLWGSERTGSVHSGFDAAVSYAGSQFGVIMHYLHLAFWPRLLVLDPWWPAPYSVAQILPPAIIVLGLLGLTVWALVKRSAWAILGVWFFLILAPSSSVLPLLDRMFEYRVYLPLAAVIGAVVLGLYLLGGLLARRLNAGAARAFGVAGLAVVVAGSVALGAATRGRNRDYYSKIAMYSDIVAKSPTNPRAHNNLGLAFEQQGDSIAAMEHYHQAIVLDNYPNAYVNLGKVYVRRGEYALAEGCYKSAIEQSRGKYGVEMVEAMSSLGWVYALQDRYEQAREQFEAALAAKPDYADAHFNYALMLLMANDSKVAEAHLLAAVKVRPVFSAAHHQLGVLHDDRGDYAEAAKYFRAALKTGPTSPIIRDVAWFMATCPDPKLRNGPDAVKLARKICELTKFGVADYLDVLAASYAESGQFDDARKWAQQARKLAVGAGQYELAAKIQSRIELYQRNEAYRQPLSP